MWCWMRTMKNDEPRYTKRGFLLIEVLITVAMLAFSLVSISRAFTNCLRAMSQIANYTTAINLAEEKIFQLQSESRLEAALAEEGVFADNPNFNFKWAAKKLEDFPDVVSGSRPSVSEGRDNWYVFTNCQSSNLYLKYNTKTVLSRC